MRGVLFAFLIPTLCGHPLAAEHRETFHIQGATTEFSITVSGTADHRSMGTFTDDPTAKWNPTRRLTITNHGDEPVVNPRIIAPGGHDWFDIESIVSEFVRPGMTDEEKSFALWQWCRHNIEGGPTYEGPIWGETRSMTRFMNAFGTGACGTYHVVMSVVGRHAGLRTLSGCLANCCHAVQQEFFGGQRRYLDAHIVHGKDQPRGWFALKLDNQSIASCAEIIEDRYLIDRAGSGADRWAYVSYFGPGSSFSETKTGRPDPCDMGITLRPGESIQWDWIFRGPAWKTNEPPSDRLASGRMVLEPRLTGQGSERDVEWIHGLRFTAHEDRPVLTLAEGFNSGTVDYVIRCPYPITGATAGADLDLRSPGKVGFAVSFDGRDFIPAGEGDTLGVPGGNGGVNRLRFPVPDHDLFHERNFSHELRFRTTLSGSGGRPPELRSLHFEVAFQAYRPSLPSLLAGENLVRYRSDGPQKQDVMVTYEWANAPDLPVPEAPAAPIHPVNGGPFGFNETMRWEPPAVEGGDTIADYEIYISARPDLAWPVITSTHRFLRSATPEFSLVTPDVLRHGETYYWQVRARSGSGILGPCSETWTFVAEGPGQPKNLRIENTEDGSCVLVWGPPGNGTSADHYEVYGSGEFGFSPRRDDEIGEMFGREVLRPANRIAETADPRFDVTDRTEVFYRVTAVDTNGNRSVPTKIVDIPSPALLSAQLPPAVAGEPYEATIPTRYRTGRPTLSLREGIIIDRADEPVFRLDTAPEWISLATETGALSGIPPVERAGTMETFGVMVEDGKGGSARGEYRIQVGD